MVKVLLFLFFIFLWMFFLFFDFYFKLFLYMLFFLLVDVKKGLLVMLEDWNFLCFFVIEFCFIKGSNFLYLDWFLKYIFSCLFLFLFIRSFKFFDLMMLLILFCDLLVDIFWYVIVFNSFFSFCFLVFKNEGLKEDNIINFFFLYFVIDILFFLFCKFLL